MRRLEKKAALVTGGAAGLGKAIALRLAEEGARVVISDIDRQAGAATAAAHQLAFLPHDVCSEGDWAATVADVETRLGALDILVNNAGRTGATANADPELARLQDWRDVFAVNVEGVFLGCRAAIPAMRRAGGGVIVNMSSIAGLRAAPYAMAYGASKAAVTHMTRSVAQHCAELGLNIRCVSVHPSNVRTQIFEDYAEATARARGISREDFLAAAARRVPMGAMQTPEDVAAAVTFLVSDDARMISASGLNVDGGLIGCDSFHTSAAYQERLKR